MSSWLEMADKYFFDYIHFHAYYWIWAVFLSLAIRKWWGNAISYTTLVDFPKDYINMEILAKIIAIEDGDGFIFKHIPIFHIPGYTSKHEFRARLAGIDAPEMNDGKDNMQPFAGESTLYLRHLIMGQKVRLKILGIDQYRRLLVYVFIDDIWVNKEMLKMGYAVLFKKFQYDDFRDFIELKNSELFAKKRMNGMWGLKDFETPGEFKKKNRSKEAQMKYNSTRINKK